MMQYDNNNIDKNLKQLENQSLPDLSKMDEHWDQMKASLTAGSQPGNGNGLLHKPGFYFLAATVTGVLLFVLFFFNKKTSPETAITQTEQPKVQIPSDTPQAKTELIPVQKDTITTTSSVGMGERIFYPEGDILSKSIWMSDSLPQVDSQPPPAKDYSADLDAFYKQLEKPSQQFVIHPLQDTIIHGKDGTALMIPANTFSTGPVTIILKEYYTYEDIITNRLSTLSSGMPLITAGMIHIMAMVDGKEVNIQPGKSIRWFLPDTSAQMRQMQLFTGVKEPQAIYGDNAATGPKDTILGKYVNYNEVDWIPQRRPFSDNYFTTRVKVLDLRDAPIRTRATNRGKIAVFRISDNPKMDKNTLKKMLEEKYPRYYKVKVKGRARLMKGRKKELGNEWIRVIADGVGDSIWLPIAEARQARLTATDTITALSRQLNYEFGPDFQNKTTLTTLSMYKLASNYNVDIRTLGWINCDRFYNDGRPKIPFIVDLQDTASNYYTMVIFDEVKSMMTGAVNGKKVLFNNIPEGIKAKIISVGIRDGKAVSASEDVVVSRQPVKDLKFEETTPDEFRKETGELDK
jgi:hypothetical protein